MAKHRRVVVARHGPPEVLQVVEEDLPEPRADEVRVRVLAAGVSAYDLMFRRSGSLPGTPRVPFTLGEDIVGVVDALGADVDPAEAVCTVVNYLTAHMAMHRVAGIRSGERILVHRVRDLTGDGVDAVFDPIGGARQLRRSYRVLRRGGRLVWFGVAATKKEGLRIIPLTLLMRTVLVLIPDGRKVPLAPDLGKDKAWYRQTLSRLLELLAEGRIKPVVADRIPLVDAARAHELLERGGYAGKAVLVAGEELSGGKLRSQRGRQ